MPLKSELAKTSIRGSVVESAANTFTEAQIDTNLAVTGQHLFICTGVFFQSNAAFVGSQTMGLQLTYSSQTDLIGLNDSDWLFGCSWSGGLAGAAGLSVYENTVYQQIDHFPIATSSLYFGGKGAALGFGTTNSVKLIGYHTKVAAADFFRLVQSR
jgi:hypothetical protein